MSKEYINEQIKKISDRIHVLEAEKTNDKYIRPLYAERSMLIQKLWEVNE